MTVFYSKEPIYRQTNDILSANVYLTPTETRKNSIEKALFLYKKNKFLYKKIKIPPDKTDKTLPAYKRKPSSPFRTPAVATNRQ